MADDCFERDRNCHHLDYKKSQGAEIEIALTNRKVVYSEWKECIMDLLPKSRLDAFADGVFAIVITLLVIDLPVPEPSEYMIPALVQSWPEFLDLVVGEAWSTSSGSPRDRAACAHGSPAGPGNPAPE